MFVAITTAKLYSYLNIFYAKMDHNIVGPFNMGINTWRSYMIGTAIMNELISKKELLVDGQCYTIKNVVYATDNESVVKVRALLENKSSLQAVDMAISFIISKC